MRSRTLFLLALLVCQIAVAGDGVKWRLIATDADTGSAVFQRANSDELKLVRAGAEIPGTGFKLEYARANAAHLVLMRRYQGQQFVQRLAIGGTLDPTKIAEIEEADRRAQAAMSVSSTVIEPPKE